MAYDSFTSYSDAADGQLALQRGLQRLAKPWNRRRALNTFRDGTGLSTNLHLWSKELTSVTFGRRRRKIIYYVGIGESVRVCPATWAPRTR